MGIDRGLVVAVVIVAVLAVGLWKPWAATDTGDGPPADVTGSPAPGLALVPATEPAPGSPSPESAAATPSQGPAVATPLLETLSLDAVAGKLANARRDGDAAWVLSAMRPDPARTPFLKATPVPADLGPDCAGGVLLGEGTAAIGVTLPEPSRPSRVTRIMLRRLFDGQPPVSVPVASAQDDVNGVVLVTAAGPEWRPGHYALTLDVMGRTGMVAFCVGRMIRLVDHSLLTLVPPSAGSPAARRALVAEIEQPRAPTP